MWGFPLQSNFETDPSNDFIDWLCGIDGDGIAGRLEVGELAPQQTWSDEVSRALGEPLRQHLLLGVQVDEADGAQVAAQRLPVSLLERGTGQDQRFAAAVGGRDRRMERRQPRRPIRIGQRRAGSHLFDSRAGVIVIAFDKPAAELGGERAGNGRLPDAGHAHEHEDHLGRIGQNARIMSRTADNGT